MLLNLSSWCLFIPTDRDPRPCACSHFRLHPYLPHVSSSLPGKLHYPLCHQNGASSAWVHVLFPLQVDLFWPGPVFLLHSHDAKNMLVQFHGDFCWHVHCPGILQWIHRYGVFSVAHCVLRLLWHPLKYSSILTSSTFVQTGLVFAVKSILLVLPLPLTLRRLRYCHTHLLSQFYSLHQDTMKLACSDSRVSFYYGLFVALCMMSDCVFIAVSYVLILKTVLGIALHGEWLEDLNICVSHICAVLIFYVTISNLAAPLCKA